jgi:hypothetical protein
VVKPVVFRDDVHFFAASGYENWLAVEDAIADEVEPASVMDAEGGDKGFSIMICADGCCSGVEVQFPFTLADLWTEVQEAEDAAHVLNNITALRQRAEDAGGVVAVEMKELLDLCRQFRVGTRKRTTLAERGKVSEILTTYNLSAVSIPSQAKEWVVIWQTDSPGAALFERMELRPTAP